MNKWHKRFLDMAALVGSWSKDPSTKVGAVIVDHKNRVISQGYNGFPRGVKDVEVPREEKLRRTIHAEENALLFAHRSVEGCTIYLTHPPCGRCAAKLIQAGIVKIVTPIPDQAFAERWADEMKSAAAMYKDAGVKYRMVIR